jgi:hypothetical protein
MKAGERATAWPLRVAIGLSVVATVLAAFAALRGPPAGQGAAAPRPSASSDADDLRAQLAAVEHQVHILELQLAALRGLPASSASAGVAPPAAVRDPGPLQTYVRIDVPDKRLTAMESGNGTIVLVTSDPTLAGKTFTVTATRQDGTVESIPLRVAGP